MKKIVENRFIKKFFLAILDFIWAIFASYFAFLIINNNTIDSNLWWEYIIYWAFCGVAAVIVFSVLKLYRSIWRYASIIDSIKIVISFFILFLINALIYFIKPIMPFKWILVVSLIYMLFIFTERFIIRIYSFLKNKSLFRINDLRDKVLIVGAGDAGNLLIKEINESDKINLCPVCFVDDDLDKQNKYISGIKVEGTRNDIVRLCKQYSINRIIICIPSVPKREISSIIKICQQTNCQVQTLPGIYQLVNNNNILQNIRNVNVEDLLGRDQIKVNLQEINDYISGKVIMITGGGGSIGSELCRQIAKSNPKQLIIFDIYENNAYDIEQELKITFPHLNLITLIGSVRDEHKVNLVFETYRPDIVYHAAAHKHVPLMETSPNEAVKNNVFGTLNVARASDKYGSKRFILISTDKAVNPTNIMGATKRICEMIIQTINKKSKCEFVAVRFGNVLGSNGSVIPLFKRQIENGGPVTVTDRNITRFFMTIPEAVSLVLQAGAYANGGEIFILDMGEPVKIYDLALNLIRLSGYVPNEDIKIEITGLRPGEKLYEEILMKEEGLKSTKNKLIHIGKPIELDEENFFKELSDLYEEAYQEISNMKEIIHSIVPSYNPDYGTTNK